MQTEKFINNALGFIPSPLDLRIAFISTYPPRKCGIATFTKDLATSLNNLNPNRLSEIIALDDSITKQIEYPWEVSKRIDQEKWEDYEKALEYLNKSIIDIVSIQHEFGIFGGPDGNFIVKFVNKLTKRYIITLHTVLENPKPNQKKIIQQLSGRASAIVVMLPVARDILHRVYKIPLDKIVAIHHGAPDLPFFVNGAAKKELDIEGKIVMTSINLISKSKGIEYAIEALPEVIKKYPNFIYLIVGQTHPVVLKKFGEEYRNKLKSLIKKLKLTEHIRFIDEYVSLEDLIKYIKASDFYITPYNDAQQISSGSLAYAIAAGKLCISTPYIYAKEMLIGGRGFLVPQRDPKAISEAILDSLAHPKKSFKMRQKCYFLGRTMTWQQVGFRYIRMLDHILGKDIQQVYPKPSLKHLEFLTTNIGLSEHSNKYELNLEEGYSSDDNARGLIVAILYKRKDLAQKYLDYLLRSERNGLIFCDSDEKGLFIGEPGDGDYFGRTFWAACFAVNFAPTLKIRQESISLITKMLPQCKKIKYLKTLAFILLGLAQLKNIEWNKFKSQRESILEHVVTLVKKGLKNDGSSDWFYPEKFLNYDNPRIAQALIEVGEAYDMDYLKKLGLDILDFVLDSTFDIRGNYFKFIGNKGWMEKGGEKAKFDEQPVEAGSTVQACFSAYKVTNLSYYKEMAIKAFAWYHGDNYLKRPLYDHTNHGVFDGLLKDEINLNQGAESILEYLLAYDCYVKLLDEVE